MKLIREYDDVNEAEIISSSLREKGVMTKVTSADSQRLGRFKSGSIKVGLWVMFEEQFIDAVEILKNPDHELEYKIPVDEMHRIETEAKTKHENGLNRIIEKGATYFFGAVLIILVIYVINALLN